jgi:hypothetical protein
MSDTCHEGIGPHHRYYRLAYILSLVQLRVCLCRSTRRLELDVLSFERTPTDLI